MIGPLPLPRHEVFAQAVTRKATHSRIPAPEMERHEHPRRGCSQMLT
jgi:hypothetical protein